MTYLGITGLINFDDWDKPDYKEPGGINSVIKRLLPYLKADKIYLYGVTYHKENLFREIQVSPGMSVYSVFYMKPDSIVPRRVMAMAFGWRMRRILKMHNVQWVYSNAEEVAYWLPSTVKYIHHVHTFVNVLEVSAGRLAQLSVFRKMWSALREHIIKKSYKTIAANKDVVKMLVPLIGKERIIEFPNYVDFNRFTPRDATKLRQQLGTGHSKIALFIGRLSAIKRLELYADIVMALNANGQHSWKGVIVGGGEYESTIRNYIQQSGHAADFVFTGPCNDPDELAVYYSVADVFVITSVSELVPLTLLESLACGTPAVSTDVGVAKEVLGNQNGFVVDSVRPQDFVESMTRSLDLKRNYNLVPQPGKYSVEFASELLNREFNNA